MSNELYNKLYISNESWYCQPCTLPKFSDSYFIEKSDANPDPQIDAITASDVNINSEAEDQHVGDIFEDLVKLRKWAPANIICGYLNINSYRNKYEHIVELLQRNIIDILFISETKLDSSFPDALFNVDNFTLHRSDRNQHGGGVLVYVRADLTGDRVKQTEFNDLEAIAVEVTSEGEKLLFVGAYNPPNMSDKTFNDDFKINTDKICKNYDNFMIMGDMNFNMLDEQRSSVLNDLCDIFCLKNLV